MSHAAAYKLKPLSVLMRLLPTALPGKARLARQLLGAALGARDYELRDGDGCAYVIPSLREPIGFHLLIDSVYEPASHKFLLSRLHAGGVFVDVGANIGVFTVPAALRAGPKGVVLAIEPAPAIAGYLRRNIVLNGLKNVRVKQCAAFERNEDELPFYHAPTEHFGMEALAAQFHDSPISVPGRTLDDLLAEEQLARVDLIKIDVEGFEASVLQGASQLLKRQDAPTILFEFCDWAEARVPGRQIGDAQRVLLDYGYKIHRLDDVLAGREKPLPTVLVEGFEMLVAIKP